MMSAHWAAFPLSKDLKNKTCRFRWRGANQIVQMQLTLQPKTFHSFIREGSLLAASILGVRHAGTRGQDASASQFIGTKIKQQTRNYTREQDCTTKDIEKLTELITETQRGKGPVGRQNTQQEQRADTGYKTARADQRHLGRGGATNTGPRGRRQEGHMTKTDRRTRGKTTKVT